MQAVSEFVQPEKILVLMPTWRRPRILLRAIRSLQNQSYLNWHMGICVNGDSDFEAYKRELAKLGNVDNIQITRTRKQGIAYPLNAAMDTFRVSETYFAVLEDDDEWLPHFLEIMLHEIRTSDADAAICLQIQMATERR